MSIGLGKRYFVHVVKYEYGDLEKVTQWMKDNAPENNLRWFELHPIVKVEKGKKVTLKEYQVMLVEDDK